MIGASPGSLRSNRHLLSYRISSDGGIAWTMRTDLTARLRPLSAAPAARSSADTTMLVGISCGIAVMAKASAPGRAKTRLVPPLTLR